MQNYFTSLTWQYIICVRNKKKCIITTMHYNQILPSTLSTSPALKQCEKFSVFFSNILKRSKESFSNCDTTLKLLPEEQNPYNFTQPNISQPNRIELKAVRIISSGSTNESILFINTTSCVYK